MTEREWADMVAGQIREKELQVAKRNQGKIPYTTVEGRFDDWSSDDRIGWWTNGFWAGQLWLLYHTYREPLFRSTAEQIETMLDASLAQYMTVDHDSGFKWLLTAAADFKVTGSEASRNRAMLAAANLAGRMNPAGRFIRAWNDPWNGETAGWAIIDCMMNLPLLYWASEQTKDPRFKMTAMLHADMAAKIFIREDGSAKHIVQFEPQTGEPVGEPGGQGIGPGSSWSRGQSWALYGFTLSYRHTGKREYLETAEKVASYIMGSLPDSGLVPVDFCQPADVAWEDSTAAAIMACGFLELETQVLAAGADGGKAAQYHAAAVNLLKTLEEKRCCWDNGIDHIVEKCTAAYHDEQHEFAIIYGDYYFTEGILRLCGKNLFLW